MALGVAAVLAPGRVTAALVAAAYLVFTAFVALARHRGGVLGSCGCFGRPDTPATGAHLVLTAALAATAAAVALSPPATGWSGQAPAPTALLLGFAACWPPSPTSSSPSCPPPPPPPSAAVPKG